MPTSLKKAIIKPMLKKLGPELINKNYRPVYNLTFLSAYREGHSTETALLRVQNDILMEQRQGSYVGLA